LRLPRDEALLELVVQLGIAGLGALVATSVVGYLLARPALRAVEHDRGQARRSSTASPVTPATQGFGSGLPSSARHELRKPLTLLTARVQSALGNQRTVAQHETILREVQTDLDRLNRPVEQLLRADSAGNGSYAGSPRRRTAGRGVARGRSSSPRSWATFSTTPCGTGNHR
jgi:hypothetical protein